MTAVGGPGAWETGPAAHRGAEAEAPWHRLVRQHLGVLAGALLLDAGIGDGRFPVWLASQGAREVVGADLSAAVVRAAMDRARPRAPDNLRFAVADLCDLGFGERAFDAVISCETIEHVRDPARAVGEMARVLRPGGRLYLTTPNYLGLMGIYRIYRTLTGRPYAEVGQPINNVTLLPRTCAWVYNAGLRIVAVDGAAHLPAWWRAWAERNPATAPPPAPAAPPAEVGESRWRWWRWLTLHSLVVAEKPR